MNWPESEIKSEPDLSDISQFQSSIDRNSEEEISPPEIARQVKLFAEKWALTEPEGSSVLVAPENSYLGGVDWYDQAGIWGPIIGRWYVVQNSARLDEARRSGLRLDRLWVSPDTGLITFEGLQDFEFTLELEAKPEYDYHALWAEFLEEAANVAPSCWGDLPSLVAKWMDGSDPRFYRELEAAAKAALRRFLEIMVPLHIAYEIASQRVGLLHWLRGANRKGKLTLDDIRGCAREVLSDQDEGEVEALIIATLLRHYPDKGKQRLLSEVTKAYPRTMPRIFRALFAQDASFISSLVSGLEAKCGEYSECKFEDLIVALPEMELPEPPTKRRRTIRADTTLLCLE